MTNEMTTTNPIDSALAGFGGFDALVESVAESNAQAAAAAASLPGGVSYMKFMKFGEENRDVSPWCFGRDDDKHWVHPDAVWLLDYKTLERGWSGHKSSGTGGEVKKGEAPDTILTPWYSKFPEKDPERVWVKKPTFKFRAICVEAPEGFEDQIGQIVEVMVWQAMAEGFMDIETALRARVAAVARARAGGNEAQAKELGNTSYPRVRFDFKLGVATKNFGRHNKPILKHCGWGAPVVFATDAAPATPKENLAEAIAEAQADEATEAPAAEAAPKKRAGRSR